MGHEHDHEHDHDHDEHDHDEHDHDHGSFATGQEGEDEAPEKEHRGDFAEGQQAGHSTVHDQCGDFAEGQEGEDEEHPHHGDDRRGDYARGLDRDD